MVFKLNSNEKPMKTLSLLLLLIASITNAQTDIWSGSYAVFPDKDATEAIDTMIVKAAPDLKPEDVASRYESDLKRWTVSSKIETTDDFEFIRRFLFDPEEDENEYEEFGWTELHKSGKMNCADGGHFFICQTTPNTTVTFPTEESVLTKTGIFGIWLHYGYVVLEKIK